MRRALAAALLIAMAGSSAEAKPVVAVYGLETRSLSLDAEVLESLTTYLASRLAESGAFEVVPQERLRQALTAKKKESYRECYSRSCQIEIGQEVAADQVLSTQVMRVGTRCLVACSLYDLKRSTSGRAATHQGGCSEDGISASLDVVIGKLTGKAELLVEPRTATEPAPSSAPQPAPPPPATTVEAAPSGPLPVRRGWLVEGQGGYSFASLGGESSSGGYVSLAAGYRFRQLTADLKGFFAGGHLSEEEAKQYWVGGALAGGCAMLAPGLFELELGAHLGYAASKAGAGSSGNLALQADLGFRAAPGNAVGKRYFGIGVDLGYLYQVGGGHLVTAAFTLSVLVH